MKFPVDVLLQKEWTVAEIGSPDGLGINDAAYWLAGLMSRTAFVFKPVSFGPEVITTYSGEAGSSAGAEKFAYGFTQSLAFTFTPAESSMTGVMIGRKLTESATMTPTPTDIPAEAPDPKKNSVWVAATQAGLARTRRVVAASFGIANARVPFIDMYDTDDSFEEPVEDAWDVSSSITIEHNATSVGFMTALRNKEAQWFRFRTEGREYGVGTPYRLEIEGKFKLANPGRGPQGSIWGATYDLVPVYDSTLAAPFVIRVLTDMAGL
jgi:hypothetical protein